MQFVPVSAGEFLMGSPDGIGDDNEHPQVKITTDAYWIGLTEVTNAQYKHFIDDNGYNIKEWWTEAGWAWRIENNIIKPAFWGDAKWDSPNQPVVGVSWYEATAYTVWLSNETDLEIRLPTEAEWERAARGSTGQSYPWGNDAPTGQLLNYNRDIGQTTNVGSYPNGASPYGAFDMAGNVWEWTASPWTTDYRNYRDIIYENDGSAGQVLRGGTWVSPSAYVRSTYRNGPIRSSVIIS
ncbi:MAG: SUMF1/EgtB/PvdO family nonheme iron enzyme [Caldilineaceae bacterium]